MTIEAFVEESNVSEAAIYLFPEGYSEDKKWTLEEINAFSVYPTAFKIKGVSYELTRENAHILYEKYLKQEIQYFGELLEFYWWLFVLTYKEKPELFKSSGSSYGGSSYSESVAYVDKIANTQKAKGILYIQKNSAGLKTIPFDLLTGAEKDREDAEAFFKKHKRVFARPCPEVPRHGFVDSRIVESVDETFDLYDQVKAVDPRGELVIMKPVEAKYNFVITPSTMTIGPGHDGATAGLSKTATFPLTGDWVNNFSGVEKAGIASDNVPYLEVVTSDKTHYLAQMRGGPPASRAKDFVIQTTVVKEIIHASGDLLEWETRMKEAAGREGVAVAHRGGSLTTHYGVHAILNRIPCITSRDIYVGDTLEAVSEEVNHDYAYFVSGLIDSINTVYKESESEAVRRRVTSMIYATQYFSLLSDQYTYYIGHAVGTMISLGIAACAGEYRHLPGGPYSGKYSRSTLYFKTTRNFFRARKRHVKYATSFACDGWGGSYGGLKWYDCADAVIELDRKVITFLSTMTSESFKEMMMSMNRAINCAHNGGWWFNKFINESVFNGINNENLKNVLDACVHMYEFPPTQLDAQKLMTFSQYRKCKPIQPKMQKDSVKKIVKAQVRLTNSEPTDFSNIKEMENVRIQYAFESGGFVEKEVVVYNPKDFWPKDAEFQTSMATSLKAYIPCEVEHKDDHWVISLRGTELTRVPVEYGWVKL